MTVPIVLVLASVRPLYLAATFFMASDLMQWREMLLPWERRILRFVAEFGMSADEKRKVAEMRERMRRGLPPF